MIDLFLFTFILSQEKKVIFFQYFYWKSINTASLHFYPKVINKPINAARHDIKIKKQLSVKNTQTKDRYK